MSRHQVFTAAKKPNTKASISSSLVSFIPCLLILLLPSLLVASPAVADTYFIEPLQASSAVKPQQAARFEKILVTQAALIVPGTIIKRRKLADTILKPILLETSLGTQLVIERYDLGQLLSVVEVPELDFQPVDMWDRICARAVRSVVFGNFQRPSKDLADRIAHLKVGKSVPIAAK